MNGTLTTSFIPALKMSAKQLLSPTILLKREECPLKIHKVSSKVVLPLFSLTAGSFACLYQNTVKKIHETQKERTPEPRRGIDVDPLVNNIETELVKQVIFSQELNHERECRDKGLLLAWNAPIPRMPRRVKKVPDNVLPPE
jgi:hypothetical protein